MKDVTTRKITTGMLFVIMVLSIFFSTGAFAANVVETDAVKTAEEIGVEYRGHVENIGDMPAGEDNFIAGPEALGTRGRSLRVEGFMIKLTGDVPEVLFSKLFALNFIIISQNKRRYRIKYSAA